jgi:hypothetical protein
MHGTGTSLQSAVIRDNLEMNDLEGTGFIGHYIAKYIQIGIYRSKESKASFEVMLER